MPYIKCISIKGSVSGCLKYIANPSKTHEMVYVSGLNCSENINIAEKEFCMTYQHYSHKDFYEKASNSKSSVKAFHIIQSFKSDECDAKLAHKIGMEWVQKAFGENYQAVVCTHIDKDNVANTYDPYNYLTDDIKTSINDYIGLYQEYAYDVKEQMEANVNINNDKLLDSYNYYNDYVTSLKDNALQCHDDEQNKLSDALNSFYTIKKENSDDNRQMLGEFASLMPFSKNNSIINKDVIEFTVSPIEFVNTNIKRINGDKDENQLPFYTNVLIIGLFIVFCFSIIVELVCVIRKKRDINE